ATRSLSMICLSQQKKNAKLERYARRVHLFLQANVALKFAQNKLGFQATEKVAFGLIKLSILFLWRRIFGHVRSFSIVSWVMIGVVIAWSIAFFLATIFHCGVRWSFDLAPLSKCSERELDILTVYTATDIIVDLLIIAMPIPMVRRTGLTTAGYTDLRQIWSLHLSFRKRLAVNAIFLIGFL
ncbi:MAG: hypothetical protein Q9201_007867, partial [Fulgogasparrea decipioides]